MFNQSLLKDADDDTELTKTIKQTIKNDLIPRYSSEETTQLLKLSSLLDPRFKCKYINDESIEEVKSQIVTEGTSLQSPQEYETNETSSTTSRIPKRRKVRNLGSLFKEKEKQDKSQSCTYTHEEQITTELDKYLSAARLDTEEEPLLWWKDHENTYPMLSRLARKYLAVCATSSASERLFSSSGHIVNHLRCNLNPTKVNMLVFLNNNL